MKKEERRRRLLEAAELVFDSLDHAESVAACATCVFNIQAMHNGPAKYQVSGPRPHQ